MPLTFHYLMNLCQLNTTYNRGAAYCRENRVRIWADMPLPEGGRMLSARVLGSGGTQYETSFAVSADGNSLTSYSCSCPAFESYEGPCKHVVALVLAANQSPSRSEQARSDGMAARLFTHYAQKAVLETVPPVTGVKLQPILDIAGRVPSVSFKIGRERMYILKDINQFVGSVRRGEDCTYGKNLSFYHCQSAFEEQSARLVRFLLTYYDINNPMYAGGSCFGGERFRRMYLPPFMLDAFFSLLEGREISLELARTEKTASVRTANPSLRLLIDRQPDGTYTMGLGKPFYFLKGDACVCLVLDNCVYRCDSAFSAAVGELLQTLSLARAHKITVGEQDMPLLAASVLPSLHPYIKIVSNEDLSVFQPPERQSKVYFDLPEPELVTVRLEHHYGESWHPGFQADTGRALDIKGERQLEALLRRYFPEETVPGERVIRGDEGAIYALADHGVEEIAQLAEVFATDRFHSMRVSPPASVSVGVRVESDLLRLRFEVEGLDPAELERVLTSYRKAKKYHRLYNGSFLSLEDGALAEALELAQGLDLTAKELASGEISVAKYRALYLDTMLRESSRIQYDRDHAFKRIIRDVRDVSDADYPIPEGLRHVLRNYQKTGYRWLRTIAAYGFGGILADDMGLGKTLQVIALLLAQKEEQAEPAPSLVVCPASLVLNWESEVRKFAPSLEAVPVVGSAAAREALIQGAFSADLLITSYDLLKRDVEQYEGLAFQYVVADEAQYMKNQNTQNAKAVKALKGSVRLALTGTPVENSLAELWSVFDYLMPGYLYSYNQFRKEYETPVVRQGDEAAAGKLRKMVAPFLLRRMKKDVLKELPPKIETVYYADFEEEQKKLYLASVLEAREKLDAGLGDSGADKLQILALLTRLRQICCDPALVYENYTAGSAKLELCMELLQQCMESGHRVLLFSQFTSMLSRIAARLTALGVSYFTITGQTDTAGRLDLVNEFNAGEVPVFLISLKAGGTGLNLTGADVVIHYDPWWNSSAQNQATDRAHRIGQTNTVQVYKLIARDTLEERILEMQKNKADLANQIVKEGDGAFARMSKQEILALFD